MSPTARSESNPSGKAKPAATPSTARGGAEFPPPLKPHPRLLLVISLIFAIWVAGLLMMYYKTVYPFRHDTSRNAPEVDK
jgi:hypothetical protein